MAELRAGCLKVEEYFKNRKFIIPNYQRPYSWKSSECANLFDDILKFIDQLDTQDDDDQYVLGTLVLLEQNKTSHIIDGQQRTTSLLLLLRAIYQKAFFDTSPDLRKFIDSLSDCIWPTDDFSGAPKYDKPRLNSAIIGDEKQASALAKILSDEYLKDEYKEDTNHEKLKNSLIKEFGSKNLYVKNFLYFLKRANEAPALFTFGNKLMKNCVLMPIECDSQDNALRIFHTINARGLLLDDADIIKARIYEISDDQEKFVEKYSEIQKYLENAKNTNAAFVNENKINMKFLFKAYMCIRTALEETSSKSTRLLKFYEDKSILDEVKNLEQIEALAKLFCPLDNANLLPKRKWFLRALERLGHDESCITCAILFAAYGAINKQKLHEIDEIEFLNSDEFGAELNKLLSISIAQAALDDRVFKDFLRNNYGDIYHNRCVIASDSQKRALEPYKKKAKKTELLGAIKSQEARKTLTSGILHLFEAINCPEDELASVLEIGEIEHIYPLSAGAGTAIAKQRREEIGNKMLLESALNKKCKNKSINEKNEFYEKSVFSQPRALAQRKLVVFSEADLEQRNEQICAQIWSEFIAKLF